MTQGIGTSPPPHRGWEYAKRGDYHRQIDPNWSYSLTYYRKMQLVREQLNKLPAGACVADLGCGEGVIVEEYRARGMDIRGLDLNYESDFVQQGSVLAPPFPDSSLDAVLLLDVFEHLQFADQLTCLREIHRMLKPGGVFISCVPNLVHLQSRCRAFFRGQLVRTDEDLDHPGERPLGENLYKMILQGFEVESVKGITLSVPWLYARVISRHPSQWRWLHDLLEHIPIPSLYMFNLIVVRKPR